MRSHITSNRSKRQRGSAMIEFGLALLAFLGVLYGIMEFGRIVSSYNILAGAAREGSRYAMVRGSASGAAASPTDIQNVVRKWAVGLDKSAVAVTTTWSPGNGPGSEVTVKATYSVSPFTKLIFKKPLTLQSTSRTTISQ